MLRKIQAMLLVMALVVVGISTTALGATETAEVETAEVTSVEEANVTDVATAGATTAEPAGDYVPGEAIIVMKGTEEADNVVTDKKLNGIDSSLYEMEDLMVLDGDTKYDEGSGQDDTVSDKPLNSLAETEEIKLVKSDVLDTMELIDELNKCPDVLIAEPNYIATIESTPDFTSRQYAPSGEFGLDVPRWNDLTAPKNADGIIVAVLDSGVDYNHEDLKDVMWSDGDKYPELVAYGGGAHGYNAVAKVGNDAKYSVSDPMDEHSHGTHCAGIIAGQWNNFGISGIANGPKIMAVKSLGASGQGTVSSLVGGLDYIKVAMDAGVDVKVVNNSWGVHMISRAATLAVQEVAKRGAVLAFASSNDGVDSEKTPEIYCGFRDIPNVVIVDATDNHGDIAAFSNYGKNNTDVSSPGVDILSTIPRSKANASPFSSRKLLSNDFDGNANSFFEYTAGDDNTTVTTIESRYGKALGLSSTASGALSTVRFTNLDLSTYRPKYLTCSVGTEKTIRQTEMAALVKESDGNEIKVPASLERIDDNWGTCSMVLPDLNDYTNVTIDLYVASVTPQNFILDNMVMTNDALAYGLMSGTSMATPAVAGEAAVLMAQFPNDSAEKIAARIIGSVKRYDAHKDKCISGGIANLQYALDGKTAPVLFSSKIIYGSLVGENPEIQISGYFFGNEAGTVTVDGQNMPVKNWSDTEITVTAPQNFAVGFNLIEVTKPSGTEGLLSGHRQFLLDKDHPITGDYQMLDASEINNWSADSMVTLNNKIYISVANEHDFEGVTALYEYDPTIGRFTQLAETEESQLASNLAVVNGHLLMLVLDSQYKKPTYILLDYNPFEKTLERKKIKGSILGTPLVGFALFNDGDRLLLAGGMSTALSTDIYELFPEAGSLQKVGALVNPRATAGVFSYNGETYLAYGINQSLKPSYMVEKIKRLEDGSYTSEMVAESAMPEGVSPTLLPDVAVTASKNGAIVTGFSRLAPDNTVLADTYYLNITETGCELVEDNHLFSSAKIAAPRNTICNGKLYVLSRLQAVDVVLPFGCRDGVEDVKAPGDKLPVTTKIVGDLAVSYNADMVFTGAAIKAPELGLKVVDMKTSKEYAISSISYKNNKNVGTATFTIKALKADKSLKKALAKMPMNFNITKAKLTSENTDVKINKKGKVTSVKYLVRVTNKNGTVKVKKYTVPKKDYTIVNGEKVVIKDSSRNYEGEFALYYEPQFQVGP